MPIIEGVIGVLFLFGWIVFLNYDPPSKPKPPRKKKEPKNYL